ncbi:MAG: cyclodeaminase/cyclohydrolase family protein [Armatimonadota bacterium]
MLLDLPTTEFLKRLSSEAPTPGGGSASALLGAVGAALVSMVCNLTLSSGKYKESEGVVQGILSESERLCAELEKLVEEDAAAYGKVSAAMKMPRSTEEEKQARTAVLQTSLREACDVPLRTMDACISVLKLCATAARVCTPHAVSDIGVAAHAAAAGLRGAEMNVAVNLSLIKDPDYVEAARKKANELLAACSAELEAAVAAVKERE